MNDIINLSFASINYEVDRLKISNKQIYIFFD